HTRFALNVDIAPTIVQAARTGTRYLPAMDGHSLLTDYRRNRMFLEGFNAKEFATDPAWPAWTSLVDDQTQYIEWKSRAGAVTFRELYDRRSDPDQLDNLFVTNPAAALARAAPLVPALTLQQRCTGTTGAMACT